MTSQLLGSFSCLTHSFCCLCACLLPEAVASRLVPLARAQAGGLLGAVRIGEVHVKHGYPSPKGHMGKDRRYEFNKCAVHCPSLWVHWERGSCEWHGG